MIKLTLILLKTLWKLWWWSLSLVGVGLTLWYALRWWPGDRLLPVRLLNYFMPWLLAGLIPGLIMAGLARRKWIGLTLAAPATLISLTFAPLFWPQSPAVLAANTKLKVMSYNVWGKNKTLDQAAQLIRREEPDILLLQEVYPPLAENLAAMLTDLYPDAVLHVAYEPQAGQAVFSRFPVIPIALAYEKGRTQKVSVTTPVGPIAIWNVHPNVPRPWTRHYQQVSALAEDLAQVDGPLIVGGDFNTTDHSETYALVNQYLQNAHWEAGWGFGFTFPAHQPRFKSIPILTPLLRIDHIFYSPHFTAHSAHTLSESGGSDHFPVMAELTLNVKR